MRPLIYKDIKSNIYFIDEYGNVYSNIKKDYLKLKTDKNGYLTVGLRGNISKQKKQVQCRVATLVAYTFIGPPPADMKDPTINHKDSNILNNHYTNLEWMERSLNSSIRQNKGQGSTNHEAKLTEQQVYEICELLVNTNLTLMQIANKYMVSKSTINNIACKVNWKHVSKDFDFSRRKKYT